MSPEFAFRRYLDWPGSMYVWLRRSNGRGRETYMSATTIGCELVHLDHEDF